MKKNAIKEIRLIQKNLSLSMMYGLEIFILEGHKKSLMLHPTLFPFFADICEKSAKVFNELEYLAYKIESEEYNNEKNEFDEKTFLKKISFIKNHDIKSVDNAIDSFSNTIFNYFKDIDN